jgi:hypothetical protein
VFSVSTQVMVVHPIQLLQDHPAHEKRRNSFDETAALQTLEERSNLTKGFREYWFFMFSKYFF